MTGTSLERPQGRPGHFLDELRETFADRANQTAIVFNEVSYSFGDLDARARRCAGWLRRQGVEPGDRVALATPDKLRFLVAHLGAIFAGAIPLPLNPRFTREELRYF